MAANTSPIYTGTPDIQWAVNVTAANAGIDITSGTSYLVFTADATNGGYLDEIRIVANPSQNTVATVMRLWINNGSTTGTDTNSSIFGNIAIAATTASAVNSMPEYIYPVKKALPPGYKVYATLGTAPGGSGEFCITAFGGKY